MKEKKHVLITGGSRGIGAATVHVFAREGYAITFFYHKNAYQAEQVCRQATRYGQKVNAMRVDIKDYEAVVHACQQAMLEFGAVDILVSNAGVSSISLFSDISPESFGYMLDTHLKGLYNVTHAVLPGMISRKTGSIVTVSSIWGITGASCEVAYSTAKAGVIGFTRALAKEVGPSGIRVNCIAPGLIDTDMNSDLKITEMQNICDETPLGRVGMPEEIAETILFIASDKSSFTTGQVISPNGGLVI